MLSEQIVASNANDTLKIIVDEENVQEIQKKLMKM